MTLSPYLIFYWTYILIYLTRVFCSKCQTQINRMHSCQGADLRQWGMSQVVKYVPILRLSTQTEAYPMLPFKWVILRSLAFDMINFLPSMVCWVAATWQAHPKNDNHLLIRCWAMNRSHAFIFPSYWMRSWEVRRCRVAKLSLPSAKSNGFHIGIFIQEKTGFFISRFVSLI